MLDWLKNLTEKRPGISLEWTPDVEEKMHKLQQRTGSEDNVEVIRRAIATYDCLTEAVLEEKAVLVLHYRDGTEQEVRIQ